MDNSIVYITKSGLFVEYKCFCKDVEKPTQQEAKEIMRLKNKFTITYRPIIGPIQSCVCGQNDPQKKRLILPRFAPQFLDHKFKIINQIKQGPKLGFNLKFELELTGNQKAIQNYILSNCFSEKQVRDGQAGLILNLGMGKGKTILALNLISHLKVNTLIIVHNKSMVEQWAKDIEKCYPGTKIGYYYSDKKILGTIMIMIIDSAARTDFHVKIDELTTEEYKHFVTEEKCIIDEKIAILTARQFYSRFGYMIFDEVHLYANKEGHQAYKNTQATYMLGLSATPNMKENGFDKISHWHIGPILDVCKIPGYEEKEIAYQCMVHKINYSAKEDKYNQILRNDFNGNVFVPYMINMICSDPDRYEIVVQSIKKCLDLGLFTYVFADRREYLEDLRKLLNKTEADIMTNDADFTRIVGGATNMEIDAAECKSRVILTTYQYMGTGRSIKKMNGLVLATPKSGSASFRQCLGRIFRHGSDSSIKRHIFDIVDNIGPFKKQWNSRSKVYKEKEYPIE